MSSSFRVITPLLLSSLLMNTAQAAGITVEERSLSTPSARPTSSIPVAPSTATANTETLIQSTAISESPSPVSSEASGNSTWEIYSSLQSLQDEVAKLRGQLEQQNFLIEKLQSDLRSRYMDLDQRLNSLQEQPAQAATTSAPTQSPSAAVTATTSTVEEERKAYLAAYETFRAGGADKAIPPMLAFVKRYPQSSFTPGAYYWLGEFYLNAQTADPMSAQKHFETVLNNYPNDSRAPAALYKIASILDLQGKPKEAAAKMQELLNKYAKSDEARLAEGYLKAYEAATKPVTSPSNKPAAKPTTGKP